MAQYYVTSECARLLQKKGYPLQKVYKNNGDRPLFYDLPKEHPDWNKCDAWYIPTLLEVHQWLMTKQGIFVHVWWYVRMPDCNSFFKYAVEDMLQEKEKYTNMKDYTEYAFALQAGIMKALNLFCDDMDEQNNTELS